MNSIHSDRPQRGLGMATKFPEWIPNTPHSLNITQK
jgi:hypothetical protein